MRQHLRYLVLVPLILGAVLAVAQLVQAQSGGTPATLPPGTYYDAVKKSPALPCYDSDGKPVDVPKFSLGDSFAGQPRVHDMRRCDQPNGGGRANYQSVIYGTCQIAAGDDGCVPPL